MATFKIMIANANEAMNITSFCYAISSPLGSVTIFLFDLKILYAKWVQRFIRIALNYLDLNREIFDITNKSKLKSPNGARIPEINPLAQLRGSTYTQAHARTHAQIGQTYPTSWNAYCVVQHSRFAKKLGGPKFVLTVLHRWLNYGIGLLKYY
jgi:hypothetical protein